MSKIALVIIGAVLGSAIARATEPPPPVACPPGCTVALTAEQQAIIDAARAALAK